MLETIHRLSCDKCPATLEILAPEPIYGTTLKAGWKFGTGSPNGEDLCPKCKRKKNPNDICSICGQVGGSHADFCERKEHE